MEGRENSQTLREGEENSHTWRGGKGQQSDMEGQQSDTEGEDFGSHVTTPYT